MNNKPTLFIFPKLDSKYQNWKKEVEKLGHSCVAMKGGYPKKPGFLLKQIREHREEFEIVLIFRYLNGDKNALKVALMFLIDLMLICIAKINGCRVYWLLHNVDKESYHSPNLITDARRWMVSRASDKGYVMDPLLIPVAESTFDKPEFSSLCFGSFESISKYESNPDRLKQIEDWINKTKAHNPNAIIGACITSSAAKNLSIQCLAKLLDVDSEQKRFFFLIVGNRRLVESYGLHKHSQVYFIAENLDIPNSFIKHFDVLFKVSNDQSVLLNAYSSASIHLPILTVRMGFFAIMVESYKLGVVIENDFVSSDLDDAIRLIQSGQYEFEQFNLSHNWQIAANSLCAEG